MELFLVSKRNGYSAKARYCVENKEFVVLKGSTVSTDVSQSEKFRGAKYIISSREDNVKNGVVIKDVVFKSSSTAANFITGRSTNGLTTWKNKDGKKLKDLL